MRRPTRIDRIVAAQREVEEWNAALCRMSADDPRFAETLRAFERAIDARKLAEGSTARK